MDAQAELEQLQDELSSRASTVHFAQTGVSLVAALIFAGASGKLSWDARMPVVAVLAAVAGLISLGLVAFSVAHYVLGKRILRYELSRFEVLQTLRRQLGLDDPSVLLPQQ